MKQDILVKKYIAKCEGILEDFDNEWCWNIVKGILNWIKEHGYITTRQRDAIDNIFNKCKKEETP